MAKATMEGWEKLAAAARYDARELAKLHHVSVRQLQREFKRILGRAPQDWLNEQRVVAAQELLASGASVKRVAIDLGFKQSSHFCRQFKAFSLMTPSQYVNLNFETEDVAQG